LIQCRKIEPLPVVLMGGKFWDGLRQWGQSMMKEGVFARDEIGLGYVTDSPKEAVDLVVRSLPAIVKARLQKLVGINRFTSMADAVEAFQKLNQES